VLQDHRAHRAGHGAGHQAQGLVVPNKKLPEIQGFHQELGRMEGRFTENGGFKQ